MSDISRERIRSIASELRGSVSCGLIVAADALDAQNERIAELEAMVIVRDELIVAQARRLCCGVSA